jgi:hypothetical protein
MTRSPSPKRCTMNTQKSSKHDDDEDVEGTAEIAAVGAPLCSSCWPQTAGEWEGFC